MAEYFHQMTTEKRSQIETAGWTWGDVKEHFVPPAWCQYPDALNGVGGCWSLIGGIVTGEDFCKTCDCHRDFDTSVKGDSDE